jgi:hypothetical protein
MHSNAIAARRRAGTGILKIATAKNEQALKRSEWGRDLEAFHNALRIHSPTIICFTAQYVTLHIST